MSDTNVGSPKDRSRIQDWDKCPPGYTFPTDEAIISAINGGQHEVKIALQKTLTRKGAGGKQHTIWRSSIEVTATSPLILTKVAKKKVNLRSKLCLLVCGLTCCSLNTFALVSSTPFYLKSFP